MEPLPPGTTVAEPEAGADPEPDGGPSSPASGRRAPRHRTGTRHRRLVRLAIVLVVVTVLPCAAGVVYELALPGVADARARVVAIDRAHGGTPAGLPLPRKLSEAIVSVEDEHFYSNVFVNVAEGAGRAAIATLERSGDPGGSTIEQQLAKQLYPHGPGLAGTLSEIGLGVKLALTYSKPEILAMYLDAIYYGNGYWGDVAAARGYFGVRPDQLTWAEASLLAGLPQAPSSYDPVHHLALARRRQWHVLTRLVADHVLTATQADAVDRAPLPLQRRPRG